MIDGTISEFSLREFIEEIYLDVLRKVKRSEAISPANLSKVNSDDALYFAFVTTNDKY